MSLLPSLGAMTLAAALIAAPALAPRAFAQSDAPDPAASPATPSAASKTTVASPAGTLAVATVKLDSGWRASKLIGAAVHNEQNQQIGTVDDLILTNENKVVVAVISVGGFLGIGGKLVAVPYDQIRMEQARPVLAGASKDALNALPSFTYGNP